MISCSSSLTSSQPFTSSNVVLTSSTGVAFFEPMPKPFCTLPARPSANTDTPATMISIATLERSSRQKARRWESAIVTFSGSEEGSLSSTDPTLPTLAPTVPCSVAAAPLEALATPCATSRQFLPKRRSKSTKSSLLARTRARIYSRTASLFANATRGSCCSKRRMACCGSKWFSARNRSASLCGLCGSASKDLCNCAARRRHDAVRTLSLDRPEL
mmetsp:Transcript_67168/g.186059  ORF Transcript_67168/g.186059 Transcript_67168/m.186059 type:complete len:216 (-) Transcript_67168:240-887(-)